MRWLQAELSKILQVTFIPSHTNFVTFRTNRDAESMMRALVYRNVLVRNIDEYDGLENYLRVSAETEEENKHFIASLREVLR